MANYGMGHDADDDQPRQGRTQSSLVDDHGVARNKVEKTNEGQIRGELNRIGETIQLLQDELSVLYDKLTPILGPDHPTEAGNKAMADDSPEVSDTLRILQDHTDRLGSTIRSVVYQRSRIEL